MYVFIIVTGISVYNLPCYTRSTYERMHSYSKLEELCQHTNKPSVSKNKFYALLKNEERTNNAYFDQLDSIIKEISISKQCNAKLQDCFSHLTAKGGLIPRLFEENLTSENLNIAVCEVKDTVLNSTTRHISRLDFRYYEAKIHYFQKIYELCANAILQLRSTSFMNLNEHIDGLMKEINSTIILNCDAPVYLADFMHEINVHAEEIKSNSTKIKN